MNYVVAVSGGVDSVVLLDMLATGKIMMSSAGGNDASRRLQGEERSLELTSKDSAEGLAPPDSFIVAHFDHGIRPDSMDDATFVRQLAAEYELPFETKREELGKNASEELARNRRYAFLREIAKKHNATIVTAHHGDDVVETIAINLLRGTGWRGLAVLDSPGIERPLLDKTKAELIDYAGAHDLQWREDATNQDTKYLRNEVRQKLTQIDDATKKLLRLYRDRQVYLKQQVTAETDVIVGESPYSRHLFINVSETPSKELLRSVFIRETGVSPARPQLARALHAIKTLQAGKRFEVTDGTTLRFTKTTFIVEVRP